MGKQHLRKNSIRKDGEKEVSVPLSREKFSTEEIQKLRLLTEFLPPYQI